MKNVYNNIKQWDLKIKDKIRVTLLGLACALFVIDASAFSPTRNVNESNTSTEATEATKVTKVTEVTEATERNTTAHEPDAVELAFVITPVTNSKDATPSFVFNSSVAGTLSLGGGLKTPTTRVEAGTNYLTLNKMENGTYPDCYIMVTDANGHSGKLHIGTMTINAPEDKHLWNSIRTAGFDYDDIAVTTKESAEWLANRHDVIVAGTVSKPKAFNLLKEANPYVKLIGYTSMYTDVAEAMEKWCEERGIDPEELYYHYEEDTEVKLGTTVFANVPGYGPNGSAKTLKEARVRTTYKAGYPTYCPSSKVFREAYTAIVLKTVIVNEEEGKYLDGQFIDSYVNISEAYFCLDQTIEMRKLGIKTRKEAQVRAGEDMVKMRNQMEQEIEATIGQNFQLYGNLAESYNISTYHYMAKDKFDHVYDEIMTEYLTNLVRMRTFDIRSLVDLYEAMEKGVTIITNSETNYYDKPEKYSEQEWANFIQFTLAVQMLVAHDNGYFAYHKGSASYYGGWPTRGDLTNTHWHINREYDLGKPVVRAGEDYWGVSGTDRFFVLSEGAVSTAPNDHKILAREFEKGLVVAHFGNANNAIAPLGFNPVTVELGGKYRRLLEDNSLGEEITQITIGKGEGATLVKSN